MRTTIEQVVRFFTEQDDLAERASDIAAHLRGDERIARFP